MIPGRHFLQRLPFELSFLRNFLRIAFEEKGVSWAIQARNFPCKICILGSICFQQHKIELIWTHEQMQNLVIRFLIFETQEQELQDELL